MKRPTVTHIVILDDHYRLCLSGIRRLTSSIGTYFHLVEFHRGCSTFGCGISQDTAAKPPSIRNHIQAWGGTFHLQAILDAGWTTGVHRRIPLVWCKFKLATPGFHGVVCIKSMFSTWSSVSLGGRSIRSIKRNHDKTNTTNKETKRDQDTEWD
jgi:hypothetical protein